MATPSLPVLDGIRTSVEQVLHDLTDRYSEVEREKEALREERQSLQRERAEFEAERASFESVKAAASNKTDTPTAANTTFQPPPPKQTKEFTLSPDILVIEKGRNYVENVVDFLNKNRARPDLRDPDTPCTGIGGGAFPHPARQGSPMDEDSFLNHIASQATLAMFEKMKTGTEGQGSETPISIAEKTLTYIAASYIKGGFEHSPSNIGVLANVMRHLSREVSDITRKEPALLRLNAPLYVFGDIHGNFQDLQFFISNLVHFEKFDYTSHSLLFLGDYVDRGEWSIESVAYLWSLKVLAPDRVFLLRGNHEDWQVNGDEAHYGEGSFKHQCRQLFGREQGDDVWNMINTAFKEFPLAALVDDQIFCVHGGLPRHSGGPDRRLELLGDPAFPRFNTFTAVPGEDAKRAKLRQMAFDLVWSDPSDTEEGLDDYGFGNNLRGGDIKTFGNKAVQNFLDGNNLKYILRAHQEKSDGLKVSKHSKVVTIFSSSGYCGHGNGAGVMFISQDGTLRMCVKLHHETQESTATRSED